MIGIVRREPPAPPFSGGQFMSTGLSILATVYIVRRWPFVMTVCAIASIAAVLLRYYRRRDWRIPWWHWPIAAGWCYVAGVFALDYLTIGFLPDPFAMPLPPREQRLAEFEHVMALLRPAAFGGLICFALTYWATSRGTRTT